MRPASSCSLEWTTCRRSSTSWCAPSLDKVASLSTTRWPGWPLTKEHNECDVVLSPAELDRLLAVAPKWLQLIMMVAYDSSMRRGEIAQLRWSEIDLKARVVKLTSAAFKKACGKAGLTGVIYHDLRHSFCTNVRRAGADTLTTMAVSGHRSIEVLKRYNTIVPQDLQKAIRQLGTYMDTNTSNGHAPTQ
jgi:Phage integrase family